LSRYRGLRDQYKLKALSHYNGRSLDHYKPSKLYPKPYRKPFQPKKTSRPRYSRPLSRRGRGRLPYSKPNYFQNRQLEKKYELKPKPEKMSSPPKAEVVRYETGTSVDPWVDAEQIAKDVEERLDSKLTERILERIETEIEELMQKVEQNSEKKVEDSELGEKLEASEQKTVEMNDGNILETEVNDIESEDIESEKVEGVEDLPELTEESTEKGDISLEGGFELVSSLGRAIPLETDDVEFEELNEELKSAAGIETQSESEVETSVQEIEVSEEPTVIEQAVEIGKPTIAEESFERGTEIETLENAELFLDEIGMIKPLEEVEPEKVESMGNRV